MIIVKERKHIIQLKYIKKKIIVNIRQVIM